jgi:hypothetical protein
MPFMIGILARTLPESLQRLLDVPERRPASVG